MESPAGNMETRLKQWGSKLGELVDEAKAAGTETEFEGAIEKLRR